MTVQGKFLKITSVAAGMQLALFRRDEGAFAIFEIEILLQDQIFALKQHQCDEKTALKEYEKILKKLKNTIKKG
ncbi:MAG: hypothetical protein Q8N22_01765 [bacterium]|nr:hypothetical protein [bacterium]